MAPSAPGSSGGQGKDLILSHGIGFVKAGSVKVEQVDDGRMYAVVEGNRFEELNLNTTVSPSSSLLLATSSDTPELVDPLRRSGFTNSTFASSTSSSFSTVWSS